MKIKASMVVMSHLSDSQELINFMCGSSAAEEINFAKFVILHCNGDLTQEIDADEVYKLFVEKMKTKQHENNNQE